MITNNGPLIPDELLSKIFEPLITSKVSRQGHGLGLSLSKTLAKKIGYDLFCIQDQRVNFILEEIKR